MLRVKDIIKCIKLDEALGRSPYAGNCADKNPPAPVRPVTGPEKIVHILRHGLPLCGFSNELAGKWPANHWWVSEVDRERATCEACLAQCKGK